jgi:GntR family transcriptional regulator/MocR family aminotransferase
MDLQLSISGKGDITRQIYRQMRERIIDGRLLSGTRLPASRALADELTIARKTVTNVYDLLISEGFLVTRAGSGTFVAEGMSHREANTAESPLRVNEMWDRIGESLKTVPAEVPFDFNVGVPDVSRFPFAIWRSIVNSRSRLLARNAREYANPRGFAPLRAAITKYTGFTRAVKCNPSDVVITNGAQQAFDLISRVLIGRGTVVAMEHPGYDRARMLFEMHGAKIADIPVDDEGLVVGKLPDDARIVYVTPSHQFPMGVSMSLARRLALLEWAAERGAAIVEDDYDSEFRFAARPLDSLQSLDRHGVVLYVGTFSKVLCPAVRIGFVVAPDPVKRAIVAARELTDWHGSILMEATLARFIDDGHLARHIRKMRRIYSGRRAALLESIERHLSEWVSVYPGMAGLHIGALLRDGRSAPRLAENALVAGVRIMSYGDNGLALGYGPIEETDIARGIKTLGQVFKDQGKGSE